MEKIEDKINNFVKDNYTEKELGQKYHTLTLPKKMTLVLMKDKDMWETFKIELREKGWLI